MILTSREFDAALESELDRLVKKRIAEYEESQEFYERLEAKVKDEFSTITPFVAFRSESVETLCLYLSPKDSDAHLYADIEKAIDIHIEDAIADGEQDHLEFVLSRLDFLAAKVKGALSHNAQVQAAARQGRSPGTMG